jgi:hypothetical protein
MPGRSLGVRSLSHTRRAPTLFHPLFSALRQLLHRLGVIARYTLTRLFIQGDSCPLIRKSIKLLLRNSKIAPFFTTPS